MFKNRYKKLVIFVLIAVMSVTVGFAAFSTTLSFANISGIFRMSKEVRVTNFYVTSTTNSGSISYDEYNYNKLVTNMTLPNQDSTVTYKVEVTNLGDFIARIDNIIDIPENIYFELDGYGLEDDICDNNDNCRNGVVKEFFITFGYVDEGYDATNNPSGTYNIAATVIFSENYRIRYIGNTFYTLPRTESNLTIDYNPYTSILTLNGTQTSSVDLMRLTSQTFQANDETAIGLSYISGSYSSSGSVNLTTEIFKSDNSVLTTRNYVNTVLPTNSNPSADVFVVSDDGETEGSVFASYINTSSTITYTNYKVKVYYYKPIVDTMESGTNFTLPETDPERTNFTFDGWYTEETGGEEITEEDTFTDEEDITLYAQYTDNDVIGLPTISYENSYVSDGLELLYDIRNNTGEGRNNNSTIWKNIADNTNGTLHNNTWGENYLSFDGSSSYVNAESNYHSSYKTYEVVFSVNTLGVRHNIISNAYSGGMQIYIDTSNYIRGEIYNNSSWVSVTSSFTVEANKIYYIAVSYNGTRIYLYSEGMFNRQYAVSGTLVQSTSGAKLTLGCNIGTNNNCQTNPYYMNGKIYAARSYNRALSEDEIRNNYTIDRLYFGGYSKVAPVVNVTNSSSNVGIKENKYKINNGSFTTFNPSNKPTITTNGENTIEAYSINTHTTTGPSTSETVLVDTVNPTVSLNIGGEKSQVVATLTASDATSGIRSYSFILQTNQTCGINSDFVETSNNTYTTTISDNNDYYLCTRVLDNALNAVYIVQPVHSKQPPSGSCTTYTIPATGYYYLETWGGKGGSGQNGGYTRGYTYFEEGEVISACVGGAGVANTSTQSNAGGFNGGGPGGNHTSAKSYGGGGATDFRFFGTTTPSSANLVWNSTLGLNSRIIVAAGAGGTFKHNTNTYTNLVGGFGGGLEGGAGSSSYSDSNTTAAATAGPGTQLAGGISNAPAAARAGEFGFAPQTATTAWGGGGGGGYFGGATGYGKGGGGGSSFMSGYAGSNAIQYSSDRTLAYNTKHYSNKYFIDGAMSQNNNNGAGKARFTYYGPSEPTRINNRLENVRYIKDCGNGSTANGATHWVEFQAIYQGTNIAKGKTVTGTSAATTTTGTGNYNVITDGILTSSQYVQPSGSGTQCVTVDLGQEYDKLDEIAVWHYWADGRTYNGNITYTAGSDQNFKMVLNHNESETFNGKRINAWNVDTAANDEENPVCTITNSGNTLKSTTQTVSVNCTDDFGITGYYFGTTAPSSSSTYTSITKTTSWTENLTVNAAGTWYLVAKDTSGKTSTAVSVTYYSYTIVNQLNTVAGTKSTYTSANYAAASTYAYIAKPSTVITLSDMQIPVPTGSNSSRFRGISAGAASTTAATFLTGNDLIVTLDSNKTYTNWWWRNIIYFYYRPNGGTLTTTTTSQDGTTTYTWSLDGSNNIMRATNGGTASLFTSGVQYGQTTMDLANYNYQYGLNITRSNYQGKSGAEWICLSGCKTSGITFSQASTSVTPTNVCSNIATADCNVYIGVNWEQFATVQINGALGEKITWSGKASGSTTLDNTGKKTGIKLAPGSYTFTAGTAKTTDFSTSYSRSYTVSSGTTTINVYPAGSIYWYGNGSVANSALASKCGGAAWSYTDVNGTSSGNFTSITSNDHCNNNKNNMSASMTSSGGAYQATIGCNKAITKGSYTRMRALIKTSDGANFENSSTGLYLHRQYTYNNGTNWTDFTGNKYVNVDISSASGTLKFKGRVRTKGGGSQAVTIYAIWLA